MYLKKYLMMMAALLCVLPLSAINPQNSKMKELNVKKVSVANIPVESVPALMDEEKVAFQPVNNVNWAVFPYNTDVEFSIAHTGVYYNMECNCAGTLLIGAGAGRGNRQHAPQEVLDKVQRWASLGRDAFDERVGECAWEVALVIPYSAFFLHDITSLDGKTLRANFYKCGDKLQTPHFLSWNPIGLEKPNFHCPEFFGTLHFE